MYIVVHEFSETELNASRCAARRARPIIPPLDGGGLVGVAKPLL